MRFPVLGVLSVLGVPFLLSFTPQRPPEGPPSPARVSASGIPGPGLPAQTVDTVVIRIVADADSVVADPASVTVRPGQVVTWTCELGDWTVRFRSGQPFGDAAVGDGIRGNRGRPSGQAVRGNAEAGRYKYDIMVRVQGGQNLRADPEIIIDPGEGGSR
jgi:plastocyanin